tara:strand:- start:1446 stop:1673 length:228 start_codon:yes stop_codon:yes gene_type:complete
MYREFKIDKGIPLEEKFRSPFCKALDKLERGDSIGDLTKEEIYKYRPNFYTKYFSDRKFRFRSDETGMYRIWRVE